MQALSCLCFCVSHLWRTEIRLGLRTCWHLCAENAWAAVLFLKTVQYHNLPNGKVIWSLLNIWCKCNRKVIKAFQISIYPVKAAIDLTCKFIDGPLPALLQSVHRSEFYARKSHVQITMRIFFFFPLRNLYSKGFNYLIWIIYLWVWWRDWGATIDLKDLEPVG